MPTNLCRFFLPCLVAGSMSPILKHQFWPLPAKKRTQSAATAPVDLLALEWAPLDQPEEQAEQLEDRESDGDCGVLDVKDCSGLGVAELHRWHLPSSDEEPVERPQPARPARIRVRAPGQSRHAVPAHAAQPRPSVVASPGQPREISNPAVGRVVRVGRWPRVIHSYPDGGVSFVRMSNNPGDEHYNYRAHCGCCGATLDMSGKRHRPLGRLWAWLSLGGDGCIGDRAAHRQYIPTHILRVEARNIFDAIAGSDEFSQHEAGGSGLGEPLETW